MKTAKGIALMLMMLLSNHGQAANLEAQIRQFFQQKYARHSDWKVQVQINSLPAQSPVCDAPEITQPLNSRSWGNITVSVRCGQNRKFIQARVQVNGPYVTVTRSLNSGDKLSLADISLKNGDLTNLPTGTLLESDHAKNTILVRNISAGQPLTRSMLRRAWVVHAGQAVQIMARGAGFHISSEGKAMNNAAIKETVRVRMTSGQIVSGTAGENGIIYIML